MPVQRSSMYVALPGMTAFKHPQALVESALMSGSTYYLGDYCNRMGVWDAQSQDFFVFAPSMVGHWQRSCDGGSWVEGVDDLAAGITYPITPWCTFSTDFVTLLGGNTTDPATRKIMYTIDGYIWYNVPIGVSDTGGVSGIGYCKTLSMFFASMSTTGLYSAPGSLEWTLRQGACNSARYIVTRERPSPVILAMGFGMSSVYYYRSTDGITWDQQSLPATMTYGWSTWSDWYNKFFVTTSNGLYSSEDGLSWNSVNTSVPEFQILAHEHLLLRADGKASRDGGVNWRQVSSYGGATSPGSLNVFRGLNGRVMFRDETRLRVTSGYVM